MNTLVIARYNENVNAWLTSDIRSLFHRIIIYNKGQNQDDPSIDVKDAIVVNLSNIGRESHTYLSHILRECQGSHNHVRMPGVTVFCQGDFRDHIPSHVNLRDFLNHMVNDAATSASGFCEKHLVNCHDGDLESFRLAQWPIGVKLHPNRYGLNYRQWFERFVKNEFPGRAQWKWIYGATFAVRNENIYRKKNDYYDALIDEISYGVSAAPEVGHFFERSWFYILT